MKKVFMLPGMGLTKRMDETAWYIHLGNYLQRGLPHEIVLCDMPDAELARRRFWEPFFAGRVAHVLHEGENVVIIGHSTGGVCGLRYAENHPVWLLVLIAAHCTDLDSEREKESGWFDVPFNWENISLNCKMIMVVHAQDDPIVSNEETNLLVRELRKFNNKNVGVWRLTSGGHFVTDEFPFKVAQAIKDSLLY